MCDIKTVDELRNSIQSINVKDYGDFKRKTVTYLNRFNENNSLSDNQNKQMAFLKWYIQYHPTLQINETKQWTLNQLEKLNQHAIV